jgi:beta-lactamase regulating signal transducer with metallopeptidase domain
MSVAEFFSQPLWHRLSLTLVHFLWQGLALAALACAAVRILRLKRGNSRYAAYLVAFAAMAVAPLVTFMALGAPTVSAPLAPQPALQIESAAAVPRAMPAQAPGQRNEDTLPIGSTCRAPLRQTVDNVLQVSLPWALVGWMSGVLILSVRLLLGFLGIRRWRRDLEPLADDLNARVARLGERLGLRALSRVFVSRRAKEVVALGYLRPLVLLPAALVTQMPSEMLEAIIAHELAHIRRLDLWVNLAQRVVETLLFYHPAVWWLSARLRRERELCCDELAVETTGERLVYASALEQVGRIRLAVGQPALALGFGQDRRSTLGRVRYVLGLPSAPPESRFWLAGVVGFLVLGVLMIHAPSSLTARAGTESTPKAVNVEETPSSDALPQGWSLDYDNGLRPDGGRIWPAGMAEDLSSLEIRPVGLGLSDTSWKEERYDFEVQSPQSERLGEIHIRFDHRETQVGRMTLKPGKYLLHYRREFGEPGGNFRMNAGPFAVDLPEPGMYMLRFTPKLGTAQITGSLGECYAVNFERFDAGLGISGLVYRSPPKPYSMNGLPAGTYRLSAVTQDDSGNVLVSRAQATVKAEQKLAVNMTPPLQGDSSLRGTIHGQHGIYRKPGPGGQTADPQWFVLIREQGSGPITRLNAYEALTMDSHYVVRGPSISQEKQDLASYAIHGLAPGEYTVTVIEHPWFEPFTIQRQQSKSLTLRAGEEAVLDFDLQAPNNPQPGTTTQMQVKVAGRVLARETQRPIAGALVRVAVPAAEMRLTRCLSKEITQENGTKSDIYEARTDRNGRFEILVSAGPGRDTASVDALARGYGSAAGTFHSGGDNWHLTQLSLTGPSAGACSNLVISLPRAIYVAGVVKDHQGVPLGGVGVHGQTRFGRASWGIASTRTDELGRFEIFDFPPQLRSGETAQLTFTCPTAVPVTVNDLYDLGAEKLATLEVALPRGCRITGVVWDAGGRPAPSALVEAVDGVPFRDTTSDSNGRFELAGLRPGPISLRAHALAIDQKAVLPLTLTDRDENVTLRLKHLELTNPLRPVTLWGMQLVDLTPEVKDIYDVVVAETGVLILDPGPNHLRLDIGRLQKGYCFWIVGEQRISNVREMIIELLRQLTGPRTDGQSAEMPRTVRVVYTVRNGTNTQYLKVMPADVTELKQLAENVGIAVRNN